MSAIQQPTPNHQSESFGSGQTQFFECEALSPDHPEIQARERARQLRLQLSNPTEKQARPAPDGEAGKKYTARLTYPCQSSCMLFSRLTFGFRDKANLDEGGMWPTAFALKE